MNERERKKQKRLQATMELEKVLSVTCRKCPFATGTRNKPVECNDCNAGKTLLEIGVDINKEPFAKFTTWTEELDAELIRLYKNNTAAMVAEQMGIKHGAITSRIDVLRRNNLIDKKPNLGRKRNGEKK